MLEFKKYNSIENSFNREFMERVVAEMPIDMEYSDLVRFEGLPSRSDTQCDIIITNGL